VSGLQYRSMRNEHVGARARRRRRNAARRPTRLMLKVIARIALGGTFVVAGYFAIRGLVLALTAVCIAMAALAVVLDRRTRGRA